MCHCCHDGSLLSCLINFCPLHLRLRVSLALSPAARAELAQASVDACSMESRCLLLHHGFKSTC
jgi:hypothetical protein